MSIENPRAGWVPLLVREGDDLPDGNRELIKRGGRAVTLEALGSSLDAILDEVVDTTSGSSEAIALSSVVMSRMAAFLQTPRTRAELADAFHLQHAQADAWLQRAVEQGLVRRLSDPSRFEWIRATNDAQASLFE
ncbi:MAG TPA: hypothetical protein VGD94_03090 [Vicinamibacterales bacterium]